MTGAKYDIAALRGIVTRLKEAAEPDREIDCRIACELDGRNVRIMNGMILGRSRKPPHDECVVGYIDGKHAYTTVGNNIPTFTSSLDACVDLADRVLPGCVWNLVTDFGDYAGASVSTDDKTPIYTERRQGATLALAFLLAIFNALLAQNTDQPDG